MSSSPIAILGTGSHSPAKVLTNHELARMVDTTDEWIVSRTGIRERHIAGKNEPTSQLAAAAARAALADAGVTPEQVDLIILATLTPDQPMPATACLVQDLLGVPVRAACFDLNAACSGFLYALDTAWAMLASGRYQHALVIGAEKMSSLVDWQDRSTCVLFGDGAGAAVLGPARGTAQILGTRLYAEGSHAHLLSVPRGPKPFIQMKGREVFKNAVREMEDAVREILEQHGLAASQIACVIPHQANLRIIESLAQYLGLPLERFVVNLDRHGNTSAASIPLALAEARRSGRVRAGDLTLLVAFGAGLTYGSALVRW